MAPELNGVVPVIPMPFAADESIEERDLRRLIDFVADSGAAAMCLPAYGSEFYKLTESERDRTVELAVEVNRHRIPVVAQANHGSAMVVAKLAKKYQDMGADIISFALPRQFASRDIDLMQYCGRIADAVDIPILIQDFNPGKPTIDAKFIAALHKQNANFRYVKLEEPMVTSKIARIRDHVGDAVGILEGWGGYYMLEAIPAGICGIMPGVPLLEPLVRVYQARKQNNNEVAYDLFGSLLPFINFTLQDFELFLQVEKRLLVRRGLITTPTCRSITYTPPEAIEGHIELLIQQMSRVFTACGIRFDL